MSDSRKGRSIWKKFEGPKGEAKVENDGKLFFRINKRTGLAETNYLEWERSWKNVKSLKYTTRFAGELRSEVRETPPLRREFWIPSPEQAASLVAIEDVGVRAAMENAMFVAWSRAMQEENARRNELNEVAKTRIDLEVKDCRRS